MKLAIVHRILANTTEQFCLKIFGGTEMKDITEKALDKTGKWHKRECITRYCVKCGVLRSARSITRHCGFSTNESGSACLCKYSSDP